MTNTVTTARMTRRQIIELAKHIVCLRGAFTCLEFTTEMVEREVLRDEDETDEQYAARIRPVMHETVKQAERVLTFLGR